MEGACLARGGKGWNRVVKATHALNRYKLGLLHFLVQNRLKAQYPMDSGALRAKPCLFYN